MRPIKSSKRVNVKSQIHRAIRGCVEQLERRQLMAIGLDPVANAGGPYTVAEGSAVIISGANSFDPDGTVLGYKWDLNYNSEVGFRTSVTGNPIQYSASDGPLTRTIALRVTDIDGNTNTTTTTITVNNVAPTITLAGAESIADRSPYTLNFSATDPGADTISNWLIDWGDSTAATSVAGSVTSANHTYIGASGRIITVTATDDDGAHQAFKEITVNAVVPVVTVVAAPTAQEGVAYSISFSSTGVGGDTRDGWVVDWGDGTIVFKDAPITGDSHTYADNAARIIEVTALSVAGDPTVAT
ncbi:MAG: hypothetical protein QOE14_1713, partial [Humisphaera sp.]|nr:hypothetical protein [Humisphaera sp.]